MKMSMNNKILVLENISKHFDQPVLESLNLEITQGEFVMIFGASGSGKSTLFNIISAIDFADSGTYMFLDEKIDSKNDFSDARLHKIGFVFQNYNLIKNLSAKENIILPSIFTNMDDVSVEARFSHLEKSFSLESFSKRNVSLLSGGEQQRVALARSVFLDPLLILADEPTGNLDQDNAKIVIEKLKELNQEGKTILMISHDLNLIPYASRILELKKGKLHEFKS